MNVSLFPCFKDVIQITVDHLDYQSRVNFSQTCKAAYQFMPTRHIVGRIIQFKYPPKERGYIEPKACDLLEVSAIEIIGEGLALSLLKSGTYAGIKNVRIYGGSVGSSSGQHILFDARVTHQAIITINSLFKGIETLELINLYYEMELIVQDDFFKNLQFLRVYSLYGTNFTCKPIVKVCLKKNMEELALYSSRPSTTNLRMDSGTFIKKFHGNSTVKIMNGKILSKRRRTHYYVKLKKGRIQSIMFY